MNEDDLKRCDALMRKRDLGIPSDPDSLLRIRIELADEVPGLVAEVRRLNLQNDELRNALEEIRKLEGPGLDGSSENRSGKIARLALDGHHGNCDLFDPFGRDKPCNCALKPKAEACSVCHGSRERAGFPCPACAPKPKGESLYEVEMRLRAKEDTEKRKCDEVHPGQDVYHPEGH